MQLRGEIDAVCTARRVVSTEMEGLRAFYDGLDASIEHAIDSLDVSGKVITTGVGKSGIIAKKIAASMASTGTPAFYLSAGDAAHGDSGQIGPLDALLALSKSGETEELRAVIDYARRLNVPVVAITESEYSLLGRMSDVIVKIPRAMEACPHNAAPTTSTTLQMVAGDVLTVALMEKRSFSHDDFLIRHPGGSLGRGAER